MKFKIDENLPRQVAEILHETGHEAVTVNDQGMAGYPDNSLAIACQKEKRCIITLDLDFANIREYPPQNYSGIIVFRIRRREKPLVLNLTARVVSELEKRTPSGSLWIVDEDRIRIRLPDFVS